MQGINVWVVTTCGYEGMAGNQSVGGDIFHPDLVGPFSTQIW